MADDFNYCKNCRRTIAAANYIIHSAHCERRILLCNICDEPVPRTEIKQHFEENHTIDVCELCSTEMEKMKMEQHKDTCCKRPVPCKFCELDFPFDVLDEHENTCGTRTEKCTICKVYIMLKNQDLHFEACQREQHANLSAMCEYCRKSIPTNLFHKHISVCGSLAEKCPDCSELVLLRDQNVHECMGKCLTCEYCNTSIPMDLYCDHISLCGLQTEICPKCSLMVMLKDKSTHNCQSNSKTVGKCSICRETVPWIDMREHESSCRLSMYSSDDDEDKPKFSAIPMHQKRQSNYHKIDARPQREMQETSNIHKLKQCTFCKERYPDLIIKNHLETCGEGPFTCELCLKKMLLKDKVVHETRDCQMVHNINEEFSGKENSYSAVASGYTKSYEKKLKQCSFCNKKFPEIMFADHLKLCEERPYQCSLCLKMMAWRNKIDHDGKECTYKDKVKRQFSGAEGTYSKDAPVYRKTFEKGYLENNFQTCPYCSNKIPEAKIAEHVQCCSEGKKICRFCGIQIPREEEISHLEDCIGARNIVEEPSFQTSGGKKNKKKNKKGKQNEQPVEQKGWFSSILPGRKSSSPVKDFKPQTYFSPQIVQLPCEFCDELFPDSLLIEHQSGCRPDLVSFPNKEKAGHSDDRRVLPGRDAESFMLTPTDYKGAKNTGALPKRNRFLRNDSDIKPGEYLFSQSPPKQLSNDRDYFNYATGVPDFVMQPDEPTKQYKKTSQAQDDQKTACENEGKKTLTKNFVTPIFNFSSSPSNFLDKKSSSHQIKSPSTRYFQNEGLSETQNTELRAVGAERAEKKGIIRRDTSISLGDKSIGSPDKYNTNYQVTKSSQYSDNKKKDVYSPKMQYADGKFNIPFIDETSDIIESEKVKSTCATRLLERLDDSDANENTPELWDVTENNAKNAETFGEDFNPRENLLFPHEEDSLSDSAEHFYDAEENLKISNIASGNGSPDMDSNLDGYIQFLKDESITPSENRKEKSSVPGKEKGCSCECGNKICFCDVINQTAALENNNYLQTEAEGFEGHLQKQNTPVESTKLKKYNNAKSATNFQCEEVHTSDNKNHVKSAENASKWNEWRSKKTNSSDSE